MRGRITMDCRWFTAGEIFLLVLFLLILLALHFCPAASLGEREAELFYDYLARIQEQDSTWLPKE